MDTVRITLRRRLDRYVLERIQGEGGYIMPGDGWTFIKTFAPNRFTNQITERFRGWHKTIGAEVSGILNEGIIQKFECSFPRLLFGTNSVLIKPHQVADAKKAAESLLDQFSSTDEANWYVHRYDFALQFRCNVHDILSAYSHHRFPFIQSSPVSYYDGSTRKRTGLLWKGTDVSIQFYDKGAELRSQVGNDFPIGEVLRIECQLKTKRGAERYLPCPHKNCSFPSWFEGYTAFRKMLISSLPPPLETLPPMSFLPLLLALLERDNVRLQCGKSPFDLFAESHSPRHVSRILKEMNRFSSQTSEWSMKEMLLESGPLQCVDIEKGELVDWKPF